MRVLRLHSYVISNLLEPLLSLLHHPFKCICKEVDCYNLNILLEFAVMTLILRFHILRVTYKQFCWMYFIVLSGHIKQYFDYTQKTSYGQKMHQFIVAWDINLFVLTKMNKFSKNALYVKKGYRRPKIYMLELTGKYKKILNLTLSAKWIIRRMYRVKLTLEITYAGSIHFL